MKNTIFKFLEHYQHAVVRLMCVVQNIDLEKQKIYIYYKINFEVCKLITHKITKMNTFGIQRMNPIYF